MPSGAARNALDCAIWDLKARVQGKKIWQLAGLPSPKPLTTAYTLVIDTPENMYHAANKNKDISPLLKIKLAGDGEDAQRLRSVREGAKGCLLYTSPSPRDQRGSRMPSSA